MALYKYVLWLWLWLWLDKDILKKIIWEDAPRPCGDNHVTKIRNRKLIRVTSSNKIWNICASISVTITYIWTKFGREHKYRTINTPEWPNSHKLKIQDGGLISIPSKLCCISYRFWDIQRQKWRYLQTGGKGRSRSLKMAPFDRS